MPDISKPVQVAAEEADDYEVYEVDPELAIDRELIERIQWRRLVPTQPGCDVLTAQDGDA